MDNEKCIARVFKGYLCPNSHCSRRRGFGRDGMFCKQHAIGHPDNRNTFTMWQMFGHFSEPKTVEVVEVSETYVLLAIGNRRKRETADGGYFHSYDEAVVWAERYWTKRIQDAEARVEVFRDQLSRLRQLVLANKEKTR